MCDKIMFIFAKVCYNKIKNTFLSNNLFLLQGNIF